MGNGPDAGTTPQNKSLPTKSRGVEKRSTDQKGLDKKIQGTARLTNYVSPNTKGLWLYRGDSRIGIYKDSNEWKAELITPIATENQNGFVHITNAVKKYYTSSGKKIPKLAILEHGFFGGLVEIENLRKNIPESERKNQNYRFLSPFTIYYFKKEIEELNDYLTEDAQVIFYSCLAGAGSEGGYFLKEMSKFLKNKTVIGFTSLGESGVGCGIPPSQPKLAGVIFETGESFRQKKVTCDKSRDITSDYSKHAKKGIIIKPAKLPSKELHLPFWRPEKIIIIKKNLLDLLIGDDHLYYLGILLVGWLAFDRGNRPAKYIFEDYKECFRMFENNKQFIARRDKGIPKDCKQADGVWIVHKVDIPIDYQRLNDTQKMQYNSMKNTLTDYFKKDIPVIWRNKSENGKEIYAYIDAMLRLAERKIPKPSTIKIIGKYNFYKIFKKPNF